MGIKWIVIVACLVGALPEVAEAKRGIPFLITHGEDVAEVGAPTADRVPMLTEITGSGGLKVGYLHSHFGIFWLKLWTWDGKYVLYDGRDNYWEIDEQQATECLGYAASPPFSVRFPTGLMILVILGAGVGGMKVLERRQAIDQRQAYLARRGAARHAPPEPGYGA
ncbi:MAG: hypothetical protein R3F62_01070 [Planctomycetota bacterium]